MRTEHVSKLPSVYCEIYARRWLIWINAEDFLICEQSLPRCGAELPIFGFFSTVLFSAMAGLLWAAEPSSKDSDYPNRAITIIVPWAPAGPSDMLSRIVAGQMPRTLGQKILVENVVGAGGTTAALRVKRAAPDGYTLLAGNMGTSNPPPSRCIRSWDTIPALISSRSGSWQARRSSS